MIFKLKVAHSRWNREEYAFSLESAKYNPNYVCGAKQVSEPKIDLPLFWPVTDDEMMVVGEVEDEGCDAD